MHEGGSGCEMTQLDPLPVVHFTNEPVRGGAEEHMLMLLQRLDRKRFRPMLACPCELLDILKRDLPADVDTIPITLREPSHLSAAAKLAEALRARRVQILHSHMFQASK